MTPSPSLLIVLLLVAVVDALPRRPRPDPDATSGPIYGPSGEPDMQDVGQTTNPDCGFASSLAAIAHISPNWIRSKVTLTGSSTNTSSVAIEMYDPNTLKATTETVGWRESWTNSDAKTEVWWPGAYDHAALKLGLQTRRGVLYAIDPGDALSAITGLANEAPYFAPTASSLVPRGKLRTITRCHTPDCLFDILQKAGERDTPMILGTSGVANTLVPLHAYAVLNTSTEGERMVGMYNPWGHELYVPLDAIHPETTIVACLKDYPTWTGSNDSDKAKPPASSTGQASGTTSMPGKSRAKAHGEGDGEMETVVVYVTQTL